MIRLFCWSSHWRGPNAASGRHPAFHPSRPECGDDRILVDGQEQVRTQAVFKTEKPPELPKQ